MKLAAQYGRWTVIRHSSPARYRPTDTGVRARVSVKCVCGHEDIRWVHHLRSGESSGCPSRACRARYEAAQELRSAFGKWLDQWLVDAAKEPPDSAA